VWPTSLEGCRLFFCRGRASYFETLYLPGEQERIVGISGYVVRPPRARCEKPRVSAFTSANIDKILALKPDLVLTLDGQECAQPSVVSERLRFA
jgi:ABC-type hemin transport system substrate-binding protein